MTGLNLPDNSDQDAAWEEAFEILGKSGLDPHEILMMVNTHRALRESLTTMIGYFNDSAVSPLSPIKDALHTLHRIQQWEARRP